MQIIKKWKEYAPREITTLIWGRQKKLEEVNGTIRETAHRKQTDHPGYARFSEKEFMQYKINHIRYLQKERKDIERDILNLEHYYDKGWIWLEEE